VRRLRRGAAASHRAPPIQGQGVVIPRHEWPGRTVMSIGLFTSWWCVVGLIVLELGGYGL
jgi:hypothetical protein